MPPEAKATINTTIDQGLFQGLKVQAATEGARINQLLEEAIQDLLAKRSGAPAEAGPAPATSAQVVELRFLSGWPKIAEALGVEPGEVGELVKLGLPVRRLLGRPVVANVDLADWLRSLPLLTDPDQAKK